MRKGNPKKNKDTDYLLICPICKNIPENEQEDFINELNYKIKSFHQGQYIARQGDPVTALYVLLKGRVKAEMISESGVTLHIETIYAPNPLASAFLFAEINQFPVNVVALKDCEVMMIPKESIMKQLTSNETFLREFMAFNSNRTHFISDRLKFLSNKSIKGKLAQYILARAKGADFIMDMNQTNLAEYFGVARPSLARCLSEMINDKIISIEKRNGKILDFAKIKKLILHNSKYD